MERELTRCKRLAIFGLGAAIVSTALALVLVLDINKRARNIHNRIANISNSIAQRPEPKGVIVRLYKQDAAAVARYCGPAESKDDVKPSELKPERNALGWAVLRFKDVKIKGQMVNGNTVSGTLTQCRDGKFWVTVDPDLQAAGGDSVPMNDLLTGRVIERAIVEVYNTAPLGKAYSIGWEATVK